MLVTAVEKFSQQNHLNLEEMFCWYFEQKGVDNPERFLGVSLHKAGIDNIKFNEDGSMSYELKDPDNYELWGKTKNWLKNQYVDINNRAYKQQEAGQLENFLFNIPQNLTKEEIEKILKRKKKRNYSRNKK